MRLIDADALRKKMYHEAFETDSDMQKWESGCWIRYKMFENAVESEPTVDAVPKDEYRELLKAARKMHLWIFLNTADEEKAYEECELTDEMNALLGYSGSFVINDDPYLYPNHGGADDDSN